MKIKYYEWTCVGCNGTICFTGESIFSPMPYWFTIRTEGCVSSSKRPSFNTSVCSITCLEKASKIIDDSIKNGKFSIPNKKEIKARICDQCGKIEKSDLLNPVIGSSFFHDWTKEKTASGRKDFCSAECKQDHADHPEESIFFNLKFDQPWDKARLVHSVDSPDFKEGIKPLDSFLETKLKFHNA